MVAEQDLTANQYYARLSYLEFLEFITRISLTLFEGTEMEEISHAQKVEHFLEHMLSLVGVKLNKQQYIVEEFSSSDEDY